MDAKEHKDSLDLRLRERFPAALEPHERLGTMSTLAIQSMFLLHPDCIMRGYQVNPAAQGGWQILNCTGQVIFQSQTALSCAHWLCQTSDEQA
jgi:hypothetical protein